MINFVDGQLTTKTSKICTYRVQLNQQGFTFLTYMEGILVMVMDHDGTR